MSEWHDPHVPMFAGPWTLRQPWACHKGSQTSGEQLNNKWLHAASLRNRWNIAGWAQSSGTGGPEVADLCNENETHHCSEAVKIEEMFDWNWEIKGGSLKKRNHCPFSSFVLLMIMIVWSATQPDA